jgi:hypothetical protein
MCEAAARSRCMARAVVRSPAVPRSFRRSEPANIEQAAQYSDGPCPHRNARAPYGALHLRRLSCGNCAQRCATRAVAWTRQPRRVAGTAQSIRRTRGWRGGTLCASRARPEIRRGISRAIEEIALRPATARDCAYDAGISTCSAAIFPRPDGNRGLGRSFRWRLWSATHALDANTRTAGAGRSKPVGRAALLSMTAFWRAT